MTIKIKKFNYPLLIPMLIPFQYLFAYDIITFTMLLISIVIFIQYKNVKLNNYIKMMMILIGFGILDISITNHISSTVTIIKEIILNIVPVFGFTIYLYSSKNIKNSIVAAFKCFILSTILCTIINWIADILNNFIWFRLGETLFNMNNNLTYFSYYLICASLCISFVLHYEKRIKIKICYSLLDVFILYSSYLTAVRKAFILILAFKIILYILINFNYKKPIRTFFKLIGIICIIVLLIYFIYLNLDTSSLMYKRLSNLFDDMFQLNTNIKLDHSLIVRENLRNTAKDCFMQYPILGYGFGAFRNYAMQSIGVNLYAHNNYLELLASTGVLGFILYYFPFLILIGKCIKRINSYFVAKWIISFLILRLIGDFGEVSYLTITYMFFYSIIFIIYERRASFD